MSVPLRIVADAPEKKLELFEVFSVKFVVYELLKYLEVFSSGTSTRRVHRRRIVGSVVRTVRYKSRILQCPHANTIYVSFHI